MKKLFFLLLLVSMNLFAQEPGKAGQKIPNEIQSEKETYRKSIDIKKKNNEKEYKNPRYGNNEKYENPNKYYWNDNYSNGYAEVFLRIPEYGFFTVHLDDQFLSTPTGKFRFFDVIPGQNLLQIFQEGRLIYQTHLSVDNGKRFIFDFFNYEGLYLLQTITLRNHGMNQQNYSDLWNHLWNGNYGNSPYNYGNNWNPYYGMNDSQNNFNNDYYHQNPNNQQGNYNNGNNNQQGNHGYNQPKSMSQQDFAQFKTVIKQQPFEDTKLQMIKTQSQGTWFTSEQIKDLMKLFSFDENRLEVAKFGYDRCVDPTKFLYYLHLPFLR